MLLHALVHLLAGIAVWIAALLLLKEGCWSKRSLFILASVLAANLIDLDHLLADPIYDPLRCSIGFHPLHTAWAMVAYFVALRWEKTRYVALGIFAHLIVDGISCL